jgi:hypothetical protein
MVRGASCTTGTGLAIVSAACVFGNEVLNTAAFSPGSVRGSAVGRVVMTSEANNARTPTTKIVMSALPTSMNGSCSAAADSTGSSSAGSPSAGSSPAHSSSGMALYPSGAI